jgi:hypothetical protein
MSRHTTPEGEDEDTLYFNGAWDAAQKRKQGQGLGPISMDDIQRAVAKQWGKRCESTWAHLSATDPSNGMHISKSSGDVPTKNPVKDGTIHHQF